MIEIGKRNKRKKGITQVALTGRTRGARVAGDEADDVAAVREMAGGSGGSRRRRCSCPRRRRGGGRCAVRRGRARGVDGAGWLGPHRRRAVAGGGGAACGSGEQFGQPGGGIECGSRGNWKRRPGPLKGRPRAERGRRVEGGENGEGGGQGRLPVCVRTYRRSWGATEVGDEGERAGGLVAGSAQGEKGKGARGGLAGPFRPLVGPVGSATFFLFSLFFSISFSHLKMHLVCQNYSEKSK
jgi:hypothetical protein